MMLTNTYIFLVVIITEFHNSFGFSSIPSATLENIPMTSSKLSTFLEETAPKPATKLNHPVSVQPKLQPTKRNLQFPNFHENFLEFEPIPNNFNEVEQEPMSDVGPALQPFEAYPYNFYDPINDGATQAFPPSIMVIPEPIDDLKFIYAKAGEGVMVPTGRQIVFRPLFAYRRQNAQRRRIYSKPPPSSSTSYKYQSNRRQEYPYRYSSYNYPYQYNNNYYNNNAQYDYVP